MGERTLYVFGNGFDIAHGIKTPYSAFREFLEKEHEEFLTTFEAMYSIQPLDDTEPWYTEEAQKRWKESVIKDLWQTFENEIGNPNVEGMYDHAFSLVDSMSEYGVRDTLDVYWREQYSFVDDLQKYVLEWLQTIDCSAATCKKDAMYGANTDFFMTFNYTDTIERVYHIQNVFHPHGGIPSCSKVNPIMGHGNKYLIDSYRRKAIQAQSESVEWYESICNAIADFCNSMYKDVEGIIERNQVFFKRIEDVDRIMVLGVSFGDVDIPYLERIKSAVKPETKWYIYYYGDESKRRLKEVFGILGISSRFETYFLPCDRVWDR